MSEKYLVKRKIGFRRYEYGLGKRVKPTEDYKEFEIIGSIRNFGVAIDEFKEIEFGNKRGRWVIVKTYNYQDV